MSSGKSVRFYAIASDYTGARAFYYFQRDLGKENFQYSGRSCLACCASRSSLESIGYATTNWTRETCCTSRISRTIAFSISIGLSRHTRADQQQKSQRTRTSKPLLKVTQCRIRCATFDITHKSRTQMKELIFLPQAAKFLGIDPRTLRKHAQALNPTAVVEIDGRQCPLFDRAEVEAVKQAIQELRQA
jgi:hypothetical protein